MFVGLLFVASTAHVALGAPRELTPLVEYDCEARGAYTVLWHPGLDAADPTLEAAVAAALDEDMAFALALLSETERASLRDLRVAVAASTPLVARLPSRGRGIGTHVSSRWLVANGFDAEREGVIEVYNSGDYLSSRTSRPDIFVEALRAVAHRND